MAKDKTTTVIMPVELWAEARKVGQLEDRSLSNIVRRALTCYVADVLGESPVTT